MRSVSFLLVFFVYMSASGMSVQDVYGHSDDAFIVSYNQRLLKDFLKINEDFRKCISTDLEQKIINDILPRHKGWGETLPGGVIFIPHFEVFYRSRSADSQLEKGIRVEVPKGLEFQIGSHRVSSANHAFGFEVLLNQKGECEDHKIQRFMRHLLYGSQERLDLKPKMFPDVDKYPFFDFIRAELGDKKEGSIVFLRSFNLLFLNSKVYNYIEHHQKEFKQSVLRLSWKSRDEFTIYFPQ